MGKRKEFVKKCKGWRQKARPCKKGPSGVFSTRKRENQAQGLKKSRGRPANQKQEKTTKGGRRLKEWLPLNQKPSRGKTQKRRPSQGIKRTTAEKIRGTNAGGGGKGNKTADGKNGVEQQFQENSGGVIGAWLVAVQKSWNLVIASS